MKIAIANDHRGVKAVEQVKAIIAQLNHECLDFSHNTEQPIDYPDAAYRAASMVSKGQADRAILICSTGIGMSIAANKIKGIKAALCYDEFTARVSRDHNDANVLCLPGDFLGTTVVRKMVETWLSTDFGGGRHERRVNKIKAIEDGGDPSQVEDS